MFNRYRRTTRGLVIVSTIGAAAMMLAPASGMAAKKVKFGAALTPSVQPSNSLPARDCMHQDPGLPCTLVMNEALGRPDGGELAPVSGTLVKVRVIAGGPGSFRLQLTKARLVNGVWRAKAKAKGPVIHYLGQDQSDPDSVVSTVESFKVNVPIKKGWRLSMRTKKTSAYYCSGGGDNTLIFAPPLAPGGSFTDAKSTEGCFSLIEGVIKKKK